MSALKADNEKLDLLKKKQNVDVYDIKTGVYIGSFSLPSYKGFRPRDIYIADGILQTLYDKYLVTYSYNKGAFK